MNFLSLADLQKKDILYLIKSASDIKKHPQKYKNSMNGKNLLMLFEAPSLRTRLSFEVGTNQMGGHAIYYNLGESTLGKKESMKEFSRVVSRYADLITARVYEHKMVEELAKYSRVPVINAMTNDEHPCQILSDLFTIWEKKKTFRLKLAYFGDGLNNVTHSLLIGCALVGMDITIACPKGKEYHPLPVFLEKAGKIAEKSGSEIIITDDVRTAAKKADIIYTDSWMSYHISPEKNNMRMKVFSPFQVNRKIMALAKNAIFMHDLPATRGQEVTDEVIDSQRSVIIDQAENRMHAQKALMLWLLKNQL